MRHVAGLLRIGCRFEMAEPPSIYFDSTYRLRVLEEEKFKDTERLQEECSLFSQSAFQHSIL